MKRQEVRGAVRAHIKLQIVGGISRRGILQLVHDHLAANCLADQYLRNNKKKPVCKNEGRSMCHAGYGNMPDEALCMRCCILRRV